MAIDYIDVPANSRWVTVLPSAARTATPNQQQLDIKEAHDGLVVAINMSAVTATGAVTVKIEQVDPISNNTPASAVLTSAAISATGTTFLKVHPNLPASANAVAQDVVTPMVRITATHGNGVSMTYSISALLTD